MFSLAAFVAHPQFRQDSSGAGIVLEVQCEDAVQMQLFKTVAHEYPRGFRGIALPPIGHAHPVAQFGMLMLLVDHQPNAANQLSIGA